MRILFTITVVYFTCLVCSMGQQFQDLSVDEYNNFNHNPSLINIHEAMVYGLRYRAHKSKLENNYQYTNVFMEYAIPYMDSGLGLNIEQEKSNGVKKYDVGLGYSYRLKFDRSARQQLNFGVGVNYLNMGFNPSDFIVTDEDDAVLQSLGENGNGFYGSVGVSYIYRFSEYAMNHSRYKNQYLYVGVSHKNLISNSPVFSDVGFDLEDHLYLQVQSRFLISSQYSSLNVFIEPGILVSSQSFLFNQILFNLDFSVDGKLTVGGFYASNRQMGVNLGYKFTGMLDHLVPFIRTTVNVSGIRQFSVLGPGYYVSLGFSKKIEE